MPDFEKRLRMPFRRGLAKQRQELDSAMDRHHEGEALVQQWPAVRQSLRQQAVPALAQWRARLEEAKKPLMLKTLHRQQKRLKRLFVVSWLHPKAFKIRLANLALRILIFGLRLLQVLLLFLCIYGVWKLWLWLRTLLS